MAQCIRCLLCKYRDLSLDPQCLRQNQATCSEVPALRVRDGQILGGLWPENVALSANLRPMKDPVSKNQAESSSEGH